MSESRVWMITGASSGFGRAIASAALERGDRVVATARQSESVADLGDGDAVLALSLDATDDGQRTAAVAAALERFGRIDVLVNNAVVGPTRSYVRNGHGEHIREHQAGLRRELDEWERVGADTAIDPD